MQEMNYPALTVDEVAELLKCSVRTVQREISEGRLASVKLGGRRRVFTEDLRAYIALHRSDLELATATVTPASICERVCTLTCCLRDGDANAGGVAVFSATGLALWEVCPHMLELTGYDSAELADTGWRQVRDLDITDKLTGRRSQGERFVVIDYPLTVASGDKVILDVLNEPVPLAANDDRVAHYVVVVAPAPSGWRDTLPPEQIIDPRSL